MGNQEGKLIKKEEFIIESNSPYSKINSETESNNQIIANSNMNIASQFDNLNDFQQHKKQFNGNREKIPNININTGDHIENHESNQVTNPYTNYLNQAYQLYIEGVNFSKQFSFHEALFKLEESQSKTMKIYSMISNDELLKAKVDHFLQSVNSQIEFVNYQIKNQFEYKEKAGFATKQHNTKNVDYLKCFRKNDKEVSDQNIKNSDINSDKIYNDNNNNNNNKNIKNENSSKNNSEKEGNIITNDLKSKILSEIIDNKLGIKFEDVIGLDQAKQILKEIIVLPSLRPDLFRGLRAPPRGLLLFGPSGVGKTMIAKAIATESKCTFFSISASSLTSKYVGESEKLVRTLFSIANEKQPSVVFIDEIDSILNKRSDNENESSKRLKTEFLVQFDGVGSDNSSKVLIIGATNRPDDLDSAVLRRLPKRIYISPFTSNERIIYLKYTMKGIENNISEDEFNQIANMTNNYSNSDLKELCREAAYEPIREISKLSNFEKIDKIRKTTYEDFLKANKTIRGSLSEKVLKNLDEWNKEYGIII
jgi:spastin